MTLRYKNLKNFKSIRYSLVPLIFFLFLISDLSYSKTVNLFIKLKKNTPERIFNSFLNNTIKSQKNSLGYLCDKADIDITGQLIKNFSKSLKDASDFGLDRIFIARIDDKEINKYLLLLNTEEYVEYAQAEGTYRLNNFVVGESSSNDPYFRYQYYVGNASQVWAQYSDSSIVGIVDSGMDFLHPDLNYSYFINNGEYGNGKESNGIDDDGNGFIDDWRGWNFVNKNNDPSDDNIYSHGTAVAGIISAGFNNSIGISPVLPRIKTLVLKAFNSQGYGAENDVATAVLYGISRGVKVFNFSFGDNIYSRLLLDIIKYAYSRNIVIVCSAGNDNSDRLHYPSAFDEVISVASININNQKSSFSSYGETVDIYSPGEGILSCSRTGMGNPEFGNNYAYYNGTSFSAPIVSSVSAMLKSVNKNLTNEEVRGILVSTADYFYGQTSWNHIYSSGYLNILKSFEDAFNPSIARCYIPYLNFSPLSDTIPLFISAVSSYFRNYTISYGKGINPSGFTDILPSSSKQVIRDTIGYFDITGFPDTSITIRLSVNTRTGKSIEHRTIINKSRSSPLIYSAGFYPAFDNEYITTIIPFYTNIPALGIIYYRKKGSGDPYQYIYADGGFGNIGYFSEEHAGYLSGREFQPFNEYEFYIEAIAENGKKTTLKDTSFYFRASGQINNYGYLIKPYKLPLSQICPVVTDLQNNGEKTVFINEVNSNLRLNAFTFRNNSFIRVSNNNWGDFNVARDVGDVNGNGKIDLLSSNSRNGAVYESSISFLPDSRIWINQSSDEFWSSAMYDFDNDGKKEICGFGKYGLRILKEQSGSFNNFASLTYGLQNAAANSQSTLFEDFDLDGNKELIFTNIYENLYGNYSTQINIFEYRHGNVFASEFTDSIPLIIKAENLVAGDLDGDGKKEFAIGFNSNSRDLVQLYTVFIYGSAGSGSYGIKSVCDVVNYDNSLNISLKSGDIDNDGKDEIMINAGNNFYVCKYNQITAELIPVYFMKGINTYNQIVYDFDNNGMKELGINRSDSLIFIEKESSVFYPPLNISGYSSDSNSVKISFSASAGAEYYRVYKSADSINYLLYDSVQSNVFFDNNVDNKKNYFYKISSVKTVPDYIESGLSTPLRIFVHNKSKIISAIYSENLLTIKFSEFISSQIPEMTSFQLNGNLNPSAIGYKNNFEYVLTFGSGLQQGIYNIKTINLRDFYGSPVDTALFVFNVIIRDSSVFYIKTALLDLPFRIKVEFNQDVDTVSARINSNYSFEPFGLKVINAETDALNKKIVYLSLDGSGGVGASGRVYYLRVLNVYSASGIKITSGSGSVFSFTFTKEDLRLVAVYPNPAVKSKGHNKIVFANLTKTAVIYIYDINGNYINTVQENDGNGGTEWDMRDSRGKEIPTGIYIFRAEGKNSKGESVDDTMGKFAVVR